jgi:hypothetical protein
MIKFDPSDSGAVDLFEGYQVCREMIRDDDRAKLKALIARAVELLGKKVDFTGRTLSKEEREREIDRVNHMALEFHVRHKLQEAEELEFLARLKGEKVEEAKQKHIYNTLDHYTHCLQMRRCFAVPEPSYGPEFEAGRVHMVGRVEVEMRRLEKELAKRGIKFESQTIG